MHTLFARTNQHRAVVGKLIRYACAGAVVMLASCGGGGSNPEPSSVSTALALSAVKAAADTTATAAPANSTAVDSVVKEVQLSASTASQTTLTIRAWTDMATSASPQLGVRIDGVSIGTVDVRATTPTNYTFAAPTLRANARVDIVHSSAAPVNQGRPLFIAYVSDGNQFVAPSESGVIFDKGQGDAAFDGIDTGPGTETARAPGAFRLAWPAADRFAVSARDQEASRFLQQATFGATVGELATLRTQSFTQWIDAQIAMPASTDYFLSHVQSKFDLGPDYRPYAGTRYDPDWVGQRFWNGAANGNDQLRRRMAFALHKIFVVSLADGNLHWQARAYAAYLDTLHRLAFGNFRTLIEEVALSPVMGIYLSHMRNLKEDPTTNRLPDENFARELMQLFTIGLHELNNDGTPRLDVNGRLIETYTNADVMALAKVFTGWSWGYDDGQLNETNFRWGNPDLAATGSSRVDIRRMRVYPQMASTGEKRLFSGKHNALVIPANTSPADGVRMALDALFQHPNVGPFLARQLIQQLVTSNPSPAYVGRVASAFNDNGRGVRGEMGAVIRAVLMDNEARRVPTDNTAGKVREPILRVTQWMRAFGARSSSGEYRVTQELEALGQYQNRMPSVFSYFRPGYAPSSGSLASAGIGAPEMQIINESTIVAWANRLELMLREGLGWHGNSPDITVGLASEAALVREAPMALLGRIDGLLFAGRMSPELKQALMDAMQGVPEDSQTRDLARTRTAIFVGMSSPEYLVQR